MESESDTGKQLGAEIVKIDTLGVNLALSPDTARLPPSSALGPITIFALHQEQY